MNYLETAKQYTGNDVERIFFRPMLTGPSAEALGIRVLYNMPLPTVVQLWDGQRNALQKFTAAGWTGGDPARKYQKQIAMHRVKAELGFSAADYFSLVYEQISARPDVNMEDLTGTVLEEAETSLFRQVIAENIRATMWIGDSSAATGYNTFDGFLKFFRDAVDNERISYKSYTAANLGEKDYIITLFDALWQQSDARLRDAKAEGQLAFFVTSDLYYLYEKYLDAQGGDAAYRERIDGRRELTYHGIPVVDVRLEAYLNNTSFHKSFCLLTDRRNLILAVNTADAPGNEVRMWYNPDEMENRQRAVFLAGCEVLDEGMLIYAHRTA